MIKRVGKQTINTENKSVKESVDMVINYVNKRLLHESSKPT